MYEFMRFRCKKCGFWVDSSRDEYEQQGEMCEECCEELLDEE